MAGESAGCAFGCAGSGYLVRLLPPYASNKWRLTGIGRTLQGGLLFRSTQAVGGDART